MNIDLFSVRACPSRLQIYFYFSIVRSLVGIAKPRHSTCHLAIIIFLSLLTIGVIATIVYFRKNMETHQLKVKIENQVEGYL